MRFDPFVTEIPTTMALAIMVLLAYTFAILPHRSKKRLLSMQRELNRAQTAVSELEKVVAAVHHSTAEHCARLKSFKNRAAKLSSGAKDAAWHDLCAEVEGILAPTLQLVNEIANAQERIRYQSTYLMQFSESRTDPLTGLGNRRALECVLGAQFALLRRYGTPFSLAIVDIDRFKDLNDQQGHLHGDRMLCDLTGLLIDAMRTVDVVARYGGDEFVVAMPQTDLAGAEVLAERLRARVQAEMPFTVSIGVASANEADTPESIFQRADAAMYRAKGDGRNHVFSDHGEAAKAATEAAEPLVPIASGVCAE